MKKFLQFISLAIITSGFAQNSFQVIKINSSSNVPPNSVIFSNTTAGNTTSDDFDVKNTSSVTHTYVLYRYDILLNASATANFCFAGTCFGPLTTISGNLVLNAGQSASQSTVANTELTADLNEDPSTVGLSYIKYTFKNISTPSDSIQFSIRYNDPNAGVKEISKGVSQFDVFPNPAVNEISVRVNAAKTQNSSVRVLNGLGQVVITKNVSLNAGSNTVQIDTKQLSAGYYYVSYDSGDNVVTKKLVITK
jgi:hypothetical protein